MRLDFRNLVAPSGEGELAPARALPLFDSVNAVWSACQIRFILRSFANESAKRLDVPYPPQSQLDLGKIAERLNPNGYQGAIPLSIAGPWSFYDPGSGVYLNGLGWVFTNAEGNGIARMGAMMSSKKIDAPDAGLILAHELGHALSLPEGGENTIMGSSVARVSPEQCSQTRSFAQRYLRAFYEPESKPATIAAR